MLNCPLGIFNQAAQQRYLRGPSTRHSLEDVAKVEANECFVF